jgi:glycosyl transferase family 25
LQIKFINLDRSPERLAQFKRRNGHLSDVSRFRAIDGKTLDVPALARQGVINKNILATYTWGALGCAMSHLALWTHAIDHQTPLTIAEDDAIFNKHFVACAYLVTRTLPPDWDIVLWGWNFNAILSFHLLPSVSSCVSYFDQDTMRGGTERFQSLPVSPHLFRLLRAFGIVCYSISPKGARVLRGHCLPLREMAVSFPGLQMPMLNNGIDIMMNEAYPAIEAYVSFPPLVVTENLYRRSTIQQDEVIGAEPFQQPQATST